MKEPVQNPFEAVEDPGPGPEQPLQVLHPLEVADGHASLRNHPFSGRCNQNVAGLGQRLTRACDPGEVAES